jgi:hypothetical protein
MRDECFLTQRCLELLAAHAAIVMSSSKDGRVRQLWFDKLTTVLVQV